MEHIIRMETLSHFTKPLTSELGEEKIFIKLFFKFLKMHGLFHFLYLHKYSAARRFTRLNRRWSMCNNQQKSIIVLPLNLFYDIFYHCIDYLMGTKRVRVWSQLWRFYLLENVKLFDNQFIIPIPLEKYIKDIIRMYGSNGDKELEELFKKYDIS